MQIPHMLSMYANPCSMSLIHSTFSWFRHGYWRNIINTQLQYHSYAIALFFSIFFRYWTGQSQCRGSQSVSCPGWSSLSFPCAPLTLPFPGYHLTGATASSWSHCSGKGSKFKITIFGQVILVNIKSLTRFAAQPHMQLTPAQLRERCGTGS